MISSISEWSQLCSKFSQAAELAPFSHPYLNLAFSSPPLAKIIFTCAAPVFSVQLTPKYKEITLKMGGLEEEDGSSYSFSSFYLAIRSHFSSDAGQFDAFTRSGPGLAGKLAHLLGHNAVREQLRILEERCKVARPDKAVGEEDWRREVQSRLMGPKAKLDLNGKSRQFPQLTSKARMDRAGGDRGRRIVAKEKIMPGVLRN